MVRPKKLEPRRAQYVHDVNMSKDLSRTSQTFLPSDSNQAPDSNPTTDDNPPISNPTNSPTDGHGVVVQADIHTHGLVYPHGHSHPDLSQTFRFRQGLLPSIEIWRGLKALTWAENILINFYVPPLLLDLEIHEYTWICMMMMTMR